MFGKLRNISVDGYRPFNGLNIVLSVMGGIALAVFCGSISSGDDEFVILTGVATIIFFALLLFRNRKVKSIPKMIYFSVISLVFGFLAIIILLISAIGSGMSMMNGGGGNFGNTLSNIFGSTDSNKKIMDKILVSLSKTI